MTSLAPESEQIRELYARYGLAVHQAQLVERQLAMLLATEYGPGPSCITAAQYDELLASFFQKTLGNLIATLRKKVSLPLDFADRLDRTLSMRNWLVHRYFWERAVPFTDTAGRDSMIRELTDATTFLESFDQELTVIAHRWAKEHGIGKEEFERAKENMFRPSQQAT